MLQLFSASLPVSQSSRRLTPSQEESVASREQEDGEPEREYIRARQETGDIYVHSGIIGRPRQSILHFLTKTFCCDLELRNGNGKENRDSNDNANVTSDEDVVRIPINYSEHSDNANLGQQSRITQFVYENVARDFHDYENWSPRVLPTSAPDKTKEVRWGKPIDIVLE